MTSAIASLFFRGLTPDAKNLSLSSTYPLSASPNFEVGATLKQSTRDAIAHLFARYLEIFPLFLRPARPIKVELKIKPYLGVFPFVLRALKRAFSAPRI